MRVEVEVSDLVELIYYIDKKCGQVETVLKEDPKFAECVVKRQHFGDEWDLNPFVIQNSDGEDLATLDTWEVEALNAPELLSYTDVQINREQHDYAGRDFVFIIILCLFGPAAAFFSVFSLISPLNLVNLMGAIISILVILFFGLRFYRTRQRVVGKKRQIDLLAARESPTFLNALRTLASLSNIEDWKREEYASRLHIVESALAGV